MVEKIKFHETALICKILKCERISGEGEVNFLSSTRLDRCSGVVFVITVVTVWSFRFAVSGFSTCKNY